MNTYRGLPLIISCFCLALFCLLFSRDVARAAAEEAHAEWVVCASGGSVGVGVQTEFSTWSDLTALFRPSRWKNPFTTGGALSWLNAGAWRDAPGRTAKVLAGEAVVAGAVTVAIVAASDGGGDKEDPPPTDGNTGASYRSGGKR